MPKNLRESNTSRPRYCARYSYTTTAISKFARHLRLVTLPGNLTDDLNGVNRASELSIPADTHVLTRAAADVFLIVRYRLDE
jgi:hypothetical protein